MIFTISIVNCLLGFSLAYIKAKGNSPFFIFYLSLVALFIVPSVFNSLVRPLTFIPLLTL